VELVEPTPSPPSAVLEAAGLRPEGLALIPWRHRLWTAALRHRRAAQPAELGERHAGGGTEARELDPGIDGMA
jgi:hypothetical protein